MKSPLCIVLTHIDSRTANQENRLNYKHPTTSISCTVNSNKELLIDQASVVPCDSSFTCDIIVVQLDLWSFKSLYNYVCLLSVSSERSPDLGMIVFTFCY